MRKREDRAEGGGGAERGQPDQNETCGTLRPQPCRQPEIDNDQAEPRDEQDCADRKKPEPGGKPAAQSQEAGEQRGETGGQQAKRRQRPLLREQRLCHEHRHELEQRAAHRQAEPSDADHMHQDERIGRSKMRRRIADARDHQRQRNEQPRERHREVAHRPS